MGSEIREYIDKLAKNEEQRGKLFYKDVINGRFKNKSKEYLAQYAILIDESGEIPEWKFDIGDWCNCPDGISVLQLLMYQPVLFVDFGALDENAFIARYGVTSQQMAILSEKGYIIPSLGHYESYAAALKKEPNDTHSYERITCKHLYPLIRSRHCRIASKRRPSLFKSFGIELDSADVWDSLFNDALSEVGEHLREQTTGQRELGGALKVLTNNFAYVRALSQGYPKVEQWVSDLENVKKVKKNELEEIAAQLNGLKTMLASPITASYGGLYILTEMNYRNVIGTADVLQTNLNDLTRWNENKLRKEFQDDALVGALELVSRLGLDRELLHLTKTNQTLNFPCPPNQYQFERYLNFLEKIASYRERLSKFINLLRCERRPLEPEAWRDYLNTLSILHKDAEESKILVQEAHKIGAALFTALGAGLAWVFPETLKVQDIPVFTLLGLGAGLIVRMRCGPEIERFEKELPPKLALIHGWKYLLNSAKA